MEDFEKRQMMKDVGARVYALRTAANMSRETLAERLNITPQYVSEIEQGKKCMNMSIFAELGRVFHRGLDVWPGARHRRIPAWTGWCGTCGSSPRWIVTWPSIFCT